MYKPDIPHQVEKDAFESTQVNLRSRAERALYEHQTHKNNASHSSIDK